MGLGSGDDCYGVMHLDILQSELACLGMMPCRSEDETEELYLKIKTRRERAERKDDVIFEVLDAMCYNKACKTLGATERWRIGSLQKFFGWWLPIPYTMNAEMEISHA